jgi:hypothetical protein
VGFAGNLTADTVTVRIIRPTGTPQDLRLAPWQTATPLLL